MPKFLEDKLRAQAEKKGFTGRHADEYVFGTMNNIGAMHGNKETAKGREMDKKHERDTNMSKGEKMRSLRVEIHRDNAGKVTGSTVHHEMMPKRSGKSMAFLEENHASHPFSADEHEAMMEHVNKHLKNQVNMAQGEGDAAKEEAEDMHGEGEESEEA